MCGERGVKIVWLARGRPPFNLMVVSWELGRRGRLDVNRAAYFFCRFLTISFTSWVRECRRPVLVRHPPKYCG